MGSNMMDEIDCANFFDQIDDLIEFPPAEECENFNFGGNLVNSGDCNDLPNMWNDAELPSSDTFISKNAASDLSAELYVPYEDIVQLEWLSTFVEDSYSDAGLNMGKDKSCPIKKDNSQFQTSSPISVLESSSSSNSTSSSSIVRKPDNLPLCGPQRARTKRPRPATFNPRPLTIFTESENFSESHRPPTMKVPELSELDQENKKKKKKKQKKEKDNDAGVSIQNDDPVVSAQAIRKCMHCEITKTPQWRAGPMGPKTLCNACGVRYKSGRLFPEYRPAASPTFVPSVHSNSHKKVVEMRNKTGQGNIMSSNPVVVDNKSEEVV